MPFRPRGGYSQDPSARRRTRCCSRASSFLSRKAAPDPSRTPRRLLVVANELPPSCRARTRCKRASRCEEQLCRCTGREIPLHRADRCAGCRKATCLPLRARRSRRVGRTAPRPAADGCIHGNGVVRLRPTPSETPRVRREVSGTACCRASSAPHQRWRMHLCRGHLCRPRRTHGKASTTRLFGSSAH